MKQKENTSNKIRLRAYSVQEAANLYGVSGKILKKWLNQFEKKLEVEKDILQSQANENNL